MERTRRALAGALGFVVVVLLAGCASMGETGGSAVQVAAEKRVGSLVVRGVPELPSELTARLNQYGGTRFARVFGWLGNEVLIGTRFGQVTQVHKLARPMAAREQLTFFSEPVLGAYPSPDPDARHLLYLRDVGGAEFYQVFRLDLESGRSTMVSDGRSRHGDVIWNRDGSAFAFALAAPEGDRFAVEVVDAMGGRRSVFERASGSYWPLDFSPDGQRLLVLQYQSINVAELLEVDLASGSVRTLVPLSDEVSVRDAQYDASGDAVLLTSDLGGEFVSLYRLALDDGELSAFSGSEPWDVESFVQVGDVLLLSYNEGGLSSLRGRNLVTGDEIALPELPVGVLRSIARRPGSSQVALSLSSATNPEDVFVLELNDATLTRWTRSEAGGLDTSAFVEPSLIQTRSFDGRSIPAFLYMPKGPGPHPVAFSIHGGPESQYRPSFSFTVQYLVNELGVAVLAPNVRGSRGYGKSYLKLDNGVLREDSVKDIGALLDWIDDNPALDSNRVAVTGGSYGGYMVLASMVHYADRLKAGVDRVGISNFVTFLENTQPYRQDLRRIEYGDERDPEMRAFLEKISPLNRADEIAAPLLITQGYNDPRVPYTEAEQIYARLTANGSPVWFVMAMDEGHSFRKKRNRDYSTAATMLFLERYLLDKEASK
ncbi:MAG: S9 family peptidase [Pseudomonadaceae bacterium]|nr:S9 family peptidase [Pseudomonadaceae bacterium]